jgi:hypothetical protein
MQFITIKGFNADACGLIQEMLIQSVKLGTNDT